MVVTARIVNRRQRYPIGARNPVGVDAGGGSMQIGAERRSIAGVVRDGPMAMFRRCGQVRRCRRAARHGVKNTNLSTP